MDSKRPDSTFTYHSGDEYEAPSIVFARKTYRQGKALGVDVDGGTYCTAHVYVPDDGSPSLVVTTEKPHGRGRVYSEAKLMANDAHYNHKFYGVGAISGDMESTSEPRRVLKLNFEGQTLNEFTFRNESILLHVLLLTLEQIRVMHTTDDGYAHLDLTEDNSILCGTEVKLIDFQTTRPKGAPMLGRWVKYHPDELKGTGPALLHYDLLSFMMMALRLQEKNGLHCVWLAENFERLKAKGEQLTVDHVITALKKIAAVNYFLNYPDELAAPEPPAGKLAELKKTLTSLSNLASLLTYFSNHDHRANLIKCVGSELLISLVVKNPAQVGTLLEKLKPDDQVDASPDHRVDVLSTIAKEILLTPEHKAKLLPVLQQHISQLHTLTAILQTLAVEARVPLLNALGMTFVRGLAKEDAAGLNAFLNVLPKEQARELEAQLRTLPRPQNSTRLVQLRTAANLLEIKAPAKFALPSLSKPGNGSPPARESVRTPSPVEFKVASPLALPQLSRPGTGSPPAVRQPLQTLPAEHVRLYRPVRPPLLARQQKTFEPPPAPVCLKAF